MTKTVAKAKQPEPRNAGVTVIASALALMAALIGLTFLPLSVSDVNSIIFFSIAVVMFVLTLVTAIYGRLSILKALAEGIIHYSA